MPQDKDLLQPLPVPVLIVGSKYDLFKVTTPRFAFASLWPRRSRGTSLSWCCASQDLDSNLRKVVSRAIRFLAHVYGASVLFTGQQVAPLPWQLPRLPSRPFP
jgi:dynein light intermediate chain 2